jgi:hypothetical protein
VAEIVKAHPAHPCTPQRLSEAAQQRRVTQRLAGVWIGKRQGQYQSELDPRAETSLREYARDCRDYPRIFLSAAYLLWEVHPYFF